MVFLFLTFAVNISYDSVLIFISVNVRTMVIFWKLKVRVVISY